jgi:LmbE family N-acetylglucosaminyl deacetylase
MNILAIGAHPDDVDLLCGGTLALYAAACHRVVVAIATNGNVGSPTLRREEIAAIRHEEAQRSCDVIGAELLWLDFDDEWLFDDRETRTAFIDAYRHARPDLVLAHDTADYHPDHRIAGQVAQDARIPAAVRLVETKLPSLDQIPKLYTMDTVGQLVPGKTTLIDISSVTSTKIAMLTSHASQRTWLEHIFDMDYVEFMLQQDAARGAEIGVAYAEAFTEVPCYPPARPELPPLGQVPPSPAIPPTSQEP